MPLCERLRITATPLVIYTSSQTKDQEREMASSAPSTNTTNNNTTTTNASSSAPGVGASSGPGAPYGSSQGQPSLSASTRRAAALAAASAPAPPPGRITFFGNELEWTGAGRPSPAAVQRAAERLVLRHRGPARDPDAAPAPFTDYERRVVTRMAYPLLRPGAVQEGTGLENFGDGNPVARGRMRRSDDEFEEGDQENVPPREGQ